jgi:DNA-binding LacI/PurR family transcriptional regulator
MHARALGIPLDERLVRTGELSRETGYLVMRDLLRLDEPPTAVIAGNNQLLVGVLSALRDCGLRVPADISLVTCDDIDLSRLHDPPIDVIDRDPLELGRVAAGLVLSRLEARDAPARRVVLTTAFEARASSGAPAQALAEEQVGTG